MAKKLAPSSSWSQDNMNKRKNEKILRRFLLNVLFICAPISFVNLSFAESLTTKAYYPSPLAVHDHLTLTPGSLISPCQEGTIMADASKRIWFCDNTITWVRLGYDGIWTMNSLGTAVFPTNTPGNPDIVATDEKPNLKVGVGTSTPVFRLTLSQGSTDSSIMGLDQPLANGSYNASPTLSLGGGTAASPGARFIWYPQKIALRAGVVTGNQWTDANIGRYSYAFGKNNTAAADYSVISGGSTNTIDISRTFGVILSGENNSLLNITPDPPATPGDASTIVSGTDNISKSIFTFIGGGQNNTQDLNSKFSVIAGGRYNINASTYSFIGGGGGANASLGNQIGALSGAYGAAVIGGGEHNIITALGTGSVILGGKNNDIENQYSFIGGGENNITKGAYNVTADDITSTSNKAEWGAFNIIQGGLNNQATDGRFLYIGGGKGNRVTGKYISPAASTSVATGNYNSIGGGECNVAGNENWFDVTWLKYNGASCATISGLPAPTASVQYASVSGGQYNKALASYSYIGGGSKNTVLVPFSTILGGESNTINGLSSLNLNTIMGGKSNTITSVNFGGAATGGSTILGGSDNIIESSYSVVMGKNIHLLPAATGTFVFGFNQNQISIGTSNAFIFYSSTGVAPGVATKVKVGIDNPAPTPDPSNAAVGGIHIGNGTTRGDVKIDGGSLLIENAPSTLAVGSFKIKNAVTGGLIGNYYQMGYDLAEIFETDENVEPGDLVVIDENNKGKLKKSSTPYDKKAVGIVSGAPAVVFEGSMLKVSPKPFEFTKGTKPPIALAGRVPCKVSLENGPIEEGDLLTSSSTPGHLMKATDLDKAFGTVIGRALEPFTDQGKSTGIIILMVTRQ
jgi:hypothetical protein